MAFFIYQGDAHVPSGARVEAFGKAFYKGGPAVEICDPRGVAKLKGNAAFIHCPDDETVKGAENLGRVVESAADSRGTEPVQTPDEAEEDFTAEELGKMKSDELAEIIESYGVECEGRTKGERLAAVLAHFNLNGGGEA